MNMKTRKLLFFKTLNVQFFINKYDQIEALSRINDALSIKYLHGNKAHL